MNFNPTEEQLKAMAARLGTRWKYSELSKTLIYWKDYDGVGTNYGWQRATEAEVIVGMLKASKGCDPDMTVVYAIRDELNNALAENRDVEFYPAVVRAFTALPVSEPV